MSERDFAVLIAAMLADEVDAKIERAENEIIVTFSDGTVRKLVIK